jgi:hypothetical protein
MQLEQIQEQKLIQTLKLKLLIGISIVVFVVLSCILIFNNPIRNFIRSYKPLPTTQLHKQ